jgi:hypothetical protein
MEDSNTELTWLDVFDETLVANGTGSVPGAIGSAVIVTFNSVYGVELVMSPSTLEDAETLELRRVEEPVSEPTGLVVDVPFDSGYRAKLVTIPLQLEDRNTRELTEIECQVAELVDSDTRVSFDSGYDVDVALPKLEKFIPVAVGLKVALCVG